MTRVYEIDPLQDVRWPQLVDRHNLATVFHSKEWLAALHRTYGYRPSALTTSGPGESLTNALVFCRVSSWLTGRRLVSVPFSDHCTPLIDCEEDFGSLLARLKRERDEQRGKYLELRCDTKSAIWAAGLERSATFCLHRLDLRPSLSQLFHAFHESCIRRKLARSQREGVVYAEDTSEESLQKFYQLAVLTRRRHQIPPQPLSWFRNLIACMGDKVKLRLAFQGGQPVAGILTIRHQDTLTYKYGFSDSQFHRFGSMQLLLWKAIQEAKNDGLVEFDMGRTDWNNKGLLTFKDRWGATRSVLAYLRYPASKPQQHIEDLSMRVAKRLFTLAPDGLLKAAGNILYRHIA